MYPDRFFQQGPPDPTPEDRIIQSGWLWIGVIVMSVFWAWLAFDAQVPLDWYLIFVGVLWVLPALGIEFFIRKISRMATAGSGTQLGCFIIGLIPLPIMMILLFEVFKKE